MNNFSFSNTLSIIALLPAVLKKFHAIHPNLQKCMKQYAAVAETFHVLLRQLHFFPTLASCGSIMVDAVFGLHRKENFSNIQLLAAQFVEQVNAACTAMLSQASLLNKLSKNKVTITLPLRLQILDGVLRERFILHKIDYCMWRRRRMQDIPF